MSNNLVVGEDQRAAYIKLNAAVERALPPALFHIHVDAQEQLDRRTLNALTDIGFTYDLFDTDFHVKGLDGDPDKDFPHHAPEVHMTFATANKRMYESVWPKAVDIIEASSALCYVEGEFIPVDVALAPKAFSQAAFDRMIPQTMPDKDGTFVSAIDGTTRLAPARISLRRLDPAANGPKDRFRKGELHLTVRDDTHPRVLELFCALGFSAPAIPKYVEGPDGELVRDSNAQSFHTIRDIPLTMQAMSMRDVVRVANLVLHIVDTVGGVQDGSIKVEFAIDFAVMNGVDYYQHVPPVMSSCDVREDLVDAVDTQEIGSTGRTLTSYTKEAKRRAAIAQHVDKREIFDAIFDRSRC